MKAKDLIKQLQDLDPETEIYRSHDMNDDGEILLENDPILHEVTVVECPWFKPKINNLLMIPNHTICNLHNPKKVWTIGG